MEMERERKEREERGGVNLFQVPRGRLVSLGLVDCCFMKRVKTLTREHEV